LKTIVVDERGVVGAARDQTGKALLRGVGDGMSAGIGEGEKTAIGGGVYPTRLKTIVVDERGVVGAARDQTGKALLRGVGDGMSAGIGEGEKTAIGVVGIFSSPHSVLFGFPPAHSSPGYVSLRRRPLEISPRLPAPSRLNCYDWEFFYR
jgi:hypothetical protein